MGLYHGDYLKRAKGIDAPLYKRSKPEFKEKFSVFLDDKVENDREGYLKRILSDVVKNRLMLPVILVDNTDEFSIEFKEKVFQFSQALRRHSNHCLLLFPVTDKSAWSFSKTDIYGIYDSRSFFLPTPSPREVFRKRIDFLKLKLSEDSLEKKDRHAYFAGKGIKVSIDNLSGFAQVLESIFVDHDYTSKTIGELTNYNIRRTLALSQRVITSPIIKIEDLIKSYFSGEFITTSFSRFMDALIKGDYDAYRAGDKNEIFPVFKVDSKVAHSPILCLRILTLLDSVYRTGRSVEEKHQEIQSIVNYFDSIGCSEMSVEKNILSMLEAGLIDPYDVSNRDISNNQKLAISHKGIAHLRLASHNDVFFYQMALTTAINDKETTLKIKTMYTSSSPFLQKVESIKNDFLSYILREDRKYISSDCQQEQFSNQRNLIGNLDKFTKMSTSQDNDVVATLGEEFKQGVVRVEIIAVVDYYDTSKGFGFTEAEGLDSRIFIHAEILEKYGIESLKDGDSIYCDISRGPKGLFVSTIHDIESDKVDIETSDCKIIRLFPERGYGFVKLGETDKTAFFHVTVFSQEARKTIYEGQFLKAEFGPDKKGNGLQLKKILSI